VGVNHPTTKAKGSGGSKVKKTLAETRPSAKGRRVEPVISAATRAKYETATALAIKRKTKVSNGSCYQT